MAAINHGGTFYRLDKSSQSGDCGEANVMALHLASKQVMPFAFAVKGIPFGYSLTQVKAQSNCIQAGSFSPLPLLPSSRNGLTASLLLIPLTPYKEVIFNFFITPLHLKFAHESYLVLIPRSRKYMEYTRAFHLLERSFFCEGVTNKKMYFKSHVLASPVQHATTAMA